MFCRSFRPSLFLTILCNDATMKHPIQTGSRQLMFMIQQSRSLDYAKPIKQSFGHAFDSSKKIGIDDI